MSDRTGLVPGAIAPKRKLHPQTTPQESEDLLRNEIFCLAGWATTSDNFE
jgi:hypothetical protein